MKSIYTFRAVFLRRNNSRHKSPFRALISTGISARYISKINRHPPCEGGFSVAYSIAQQYHFRIVFRQITAGLKRGLRAARRGWRVEHARRWVMSLDTAHLLALMTNSAGTSLDAQDGDGLVQLVFDSYPEGQKDAIIQRIAEHLVPD